MDVADLTWRVDASRTSEGSQRLAQTGLFKVDLPDESRVHSELIHCI